MVAAAWVHIFRGDTCAGKGELAWLYLRNGRNRWIYRSWKNILLACQLLVNVLERGALTA